MKGLSGILGGLILLGCQIEASFISPELASELSKSSGPQLPGIVKSPGGNHYGYHGPYTPRPGKPYLKVGCDVLSEDGETILEILPSNASAVPFPEGRTWSHDYKSGLPAHLIDVSQHSLVIHKSDIEGWLVPDSTDVFPPPPEDLADVEARAPFRIEYANWLEKEQTVGSANWHSKHPQGLPFIPPVSKPIDGSWMDHLPDRLRTYAMTVLLTYLKDRDGWVDPTSVKNLISHLTPPSEEEIKLDDEIGRWLFDHVTSHFGVGSAHQTLRRQCGGDSHRPGGQIPVYKSGSSNTVSPVSDVIVEIGAPKGVEVVKLEIGKEEKQEWSFKRAMLWFSVAILAQLILRSLLALVKSVRNQHSSASKVEPQVNLEEGLTTRNCLDENKSRSLYEKISR